MRKGKGEKELLFDLRLTSSVGVQEGSVETQSVPPSSSFEAESETKKEAGNGRLAGTFRGYA